MHERTKVSVEELEKEPAEAGSIDEVDGAGFAQ